MSAYPNLFAAAGIKQSEIDARIARAFHTIFEDESEKFYFDMGDGHAYMMDTGNFDARTEGMSYGMMMAVQMDRKDIFDKLWLFSWDYMHQTDGRYEGYFAWSVKPGGEKKNSEGPAPDGEEYYAMALFFAGKRWGDGAAPFDYSNQARTILRHCLHQSEIADGGKPMWNPENHYIKFIPEWEWSDPSYHLMHFYKLFAELADERDRDFWREAEKASREYLAISCDKNTGMAPEYAMYDGSKETTRGHSNFYSDAYRVAMNIGLDAAWNGKTPALSEIADNLQRSLSRLAPDDDFHVYTIEGETFEEKALHPVAIIATTAAGSLAANGENAKEWVLKFWNTPLRKGERRYYDNCLYFFCLLMLAGEYKIF